MPRSSSLAGVALPAPRPPADALVPARFFGEPDARRALAAAAPALGLGAGEVAGAVLVRAVSTVVLRLGDVAAKVYPPSADPSRVAGVLAALPRDSRLAVLPVAGLPAPVVTPHGTVVLYPWKDRGLAATWAELGALLREWHRGVGVDRTRLRPWSPLTHVADQVACYLDRPDGDPDAVRGLLEARDRVLDRVAGLPPGLAPAVIHGDVSTENVLREADGRAVLIDLDCVVVGPPEYDLHSAARRFQRGEVDAATYRSFCDAYGHDVLGWEGLPVVRQVCEVSGLSFGIWAACLRGDADLRWVPGAVGELLAGVSGGR